MARELTDLHIHVGGAVAPHVLWSIAHDQGFKLPVSDYWEFKELVSARPGKVKSLDEYLAVLHQWTEKIQSSPQAMERSVYEVIGKEYRSSRVSLIELRFNPMKRNVGGERDLDHIIHAALRGMDRAVLEYGVQAGLIFCLAREFPLELNEILVEKAVRYRRRGVVGIDLAGTEKHALELMPTEVKRYRELFARARKAGLKTTVHTGETTRTGPEGVRAVVEELEPHRIGHGICAARDERVMDLLRERGITLEICPSSNLATRAVASIEELGSVLNRFWERGVKFTINTDGPYLLDTNMRTEVKLLRDAGVLSEEQLDQALRWAREATFIAEALI
jgi:adenosine deaminase